MQLILIKTARTACVIPLISFAMVGYVLAGGDCVFDEGYFSPKRYKNNYLISSTVWIDKDYTAKILLTNGALISVKHWSCNHLGLEAKQFLHPIGQNGGNDLKKEILQLGQIVLEKNDYKTLEGEVMRAKGINPFSDRLDVAGTNYSEFYVSVKTVSDSLIITIKYYRD